MTTYRGLLERTRLHLRATVADADRQKVSLPNVVMALEDIDAYLAQPITTSALLDQVLPVFSTARDTEGTCKTCGVLAPVMHDPKCVWPIAYEALTALDSSREGELVAALEKQETCGKCRLHGLVFAEAKRHLQGAVGWMPDNDARREAMSFLRMSERQVRALAQPCATCGGKQKAFGTCEHNVHPHPCYLQGPCPDCVPQGEKE
jgi:hypothetical protein